MIHSQSHDSLCGFGSIFPTLFRVGGIVERAGKIEQGTSFQRQEGTTGGTPFHGVGNGRVEIFRIVIALGGNEVYQSFEIGGWYQQIVFQLLSFRNQRCPSECLGKVEVTECPQETCFRFVIFLFGRCQHHVFGVRNGGNYQVTFADNAVIALPDFVDERSALRCDLSRIELIYICIELAVEVVGAGIEVTAESGSPVLIPSLRITVEAAYQCTVRIGYELIDKLFVLPNQVVGDKCRRLDVQHISTGSHADSGK